MKKAVLILSWLLLAMPCQAEIIIVDDDWPADFNNIQAAIDDSNDGDVIYVFPGTYTGPGNHDIDFGGRTITIQSVVPEDPYIVAATVIDCNGAGRGFYFNSGEDANSVLAGITVTNGYADYGGGIRCDNSTPTIANCIISDNTATSNGGGVYGCYGQITDCTITANSAVQYGGGLAECHQIINCMISNNSAELRGGGMWCNQFDPEVIGSTFNGNSASNGGGLSCMYGSNPTLVNCAFVQNSASMRGGGIYNHEAYAASITSCTFSGNSAAITGGGMYDEYGGGELTSCVFSGNSAGDGGGIYHYYSALPITNCTFSNNAAESGSGGGIYSDYASVSNCIFWANTASGGTVESAQISGDVSSVYFSCIQDDDPNDANIPFGGAASNNIDDYPMFVRDPNNGGDGWGDDPCTPGVNEGANDDYGDLHLQSDSPCINAGDPFINSAEPFKLAGDPFMYIEPESVDIDGQPRVMGQVVDMGADEYFMPMLIVTKPAGGEVWVSESWHEITWDSQIYEGTVDILLSTNTGGDWETIEGEATDTGSYMWHLPDVVDSNQCTISVVPSVPDPNVVCIGSEQFTIHPDTPGPAVTSKWKSLGGDFDRMGLSEDRGPELGCVKWEFEVDGAISAGVTVGPNDTVYIPCEDGNLYKLDSNGVVLWSYEANSPLISSPTIGLDGTAYVGSKGGKLYAVDTDGNLRWTHSTGGFIYSSPAISPDGNSIYACSQDGKLYALGRDGSELWELETSGFGVIDGSIFASPATGADGSVYIGGIYEPNLYALDPNDGSIKWICRFDSNGWPFASPVVAADGTIYQTLLYDANLYAIDPNDGNIIWATNLSDITTEGNPEIQTQSYSRWFEPYYYEDGSCEPISSEYYVYRNALYNVGNSGWSEPVLGPDGTIYVSFDDPYLRAVEPNGSIKWIRRPGTRSGYIQTDGYWGWGWYETNPGGMSGFSLTVDSNGLIYAASNDSNLYVVNPDGFEIGRFDSNDYWLGFPVISADNTVVFSDSRDNSMLISYANNLVWAIGGDCEGEELDLYWQGSAQDLDCSGSIDFIDFAILARDWRKCTVCWPPPLCWPVDVQFLTGDINKDLYVDFADVAALAEQWLSGY